MRVNAAFLITLLDRLIEDCNIEIKRRECGLLIFLKVEFSLFSGGTGKFFTVCLRARGKVYDGVPKRSAEFFSPVARPHKNACLTAPRFSATRALYA